MRQKIPTWKRLPTSNLGDYWFDGALKLSDGVEHRLSKEEIQYIHLDIRQLVLLCDGQFHTQKYHHEYRKETLYLIDYMTKQDRLSRPYDERVNYCVLMFDYEYAKDGLGMVTQQDNHT